MNTQYQIILRRIKKWKRRTAGYRMLNTLVFFMTKILVPAFSTIIAANLSSAATGDAFLGKNFMIAMSIAVTVFSGLGLFLRPEEKKKAAFLINNRLSQLEEKLRIRFEQNPQDWRVLDNISNELNLILDDYAAKGWGN